MLRISMLPSDERVQANSVLCFYRVGLESDVVCARGQYALDYGSRIDESRAPHTSEGEGCSRTTTEDKFKHVRPATLTTDLFCD